MAICTLPGGDGQPLAELSRLEASPLPHQPHLPPSHTSPKSPRKGGRGRGLGCEAAGRDICLPSKHWNCKCVGLGAEAPLRQALHLSTQPPS